MFTLRCLVHVGQGKWKEYQRRTFPNLLDAVHIAGEMRDAARAEGYESIQIRYGT